MRDSKTLDEYFYEDATAHSGILKNVPLFLQRKTSSIHAGLSKDLQKEWSQRKLKNEYLQSQIDYTRQKRAVVNVKKRNHYHIFHSNEMWEMDLITINSELRQWCKNTFRYLLCVVDCFDRFAFVKCLRNKQPKEVIFALNEIFKTFNRQPRSISSDRGTEFTNKDMKSFLNSKNIQQKFTITTLPAKAAIVEAFNRTLQQKLLRLLSCKKKSVDFEKDQTANDFKQSLDFIVNVYNNSVHSATKFKPIDVNTSNITKVYENIHKKWKNNDKSNHKSFVNNRNATMLLPNDFVRVRNKLHGLNFEKRSLAEPWSSEIFRIKERLQKKPYNVYKLTDLNGVPVAGKLYQDEMQKVAVPSKTPVRIIKKISDIFKRDNLSTTKTNQTREKILTELADSTTKWYSPKELQEIQKSNQRNNVANIVGKLLESI